jgi:hypothetical protein
VAAREPSRTSKIGESVPGVWPGVTTMRTDWSPRRITSPSFTTTSRSGKGAGLPRCGQVTMCSQSASDITMRDLYVFCSRFAPPK